MSAVALNPNGTLLATASSAQIGQLWDVATGQEVARLAEPSAGAVVDKPRGNSAVAFSPNGRHVVVAAGDTSAHLWEVTPPREVAILTPGGTVAAIAFSAESGVVATISEDDSVHLWEVSSGLEVAHLVIPTEFRPSSPFKLTSLALSPDRRHLAAGGEHPPVVVWEIASHQAILRVDPGESTLAVVFSPDGAFLGIGGGKKASIWKIASGEEIVRWSVGTYVPSVAFSPDGRLFGIASDYGDVRLALWRPNDMIDEACSRLTRNLTREEWTKYMGDETQTKTCPNLP